MRVGANTRLAGALRHAYEILENEKTFDHVVVKGAGQGISVVVNLAELIRRRIKGIHMIMDIVTIQIQEKDTGEIRTHAMLKAVLSKVPLDT